MKPLLTLRPARVSAVLLVLANVAIAQGPPPPPPPLGPPPPPPPANPTTPNKVLLGKTLFWDEQLSSTKTMACATCHVPEAGGSDARSSAANAASRNPGVDGVFGTADDVIGSPGVVRNVGTGHYQLDPIFGLHAQVTGRKAPTTVNAAYHPLQFWDGRASNTFVDPVTQLVVLQNGASLESQAVVPVVSSVEMASQGRTIADLVARVEASKPLALSPQLTADLVPFLNGRTYPDLFALAFGAPDVTGVRIAEAIAAYERTLFSNQTPWDSFLGGNPAALTPLETQGFNLFGSPATNCAVCHAGPLLTNQTFEYIGVRPQGEDVGRMGVTGLQGDQGRMKVPTLRNVQLRAPYFHNGSMATLDDVVAFYNRGGDFDGPNKHPLIRPLGLTLQQRNALVAFLGRPLTDPRVAAATAPFDHPALYASSTRVPQSYGNATAGTGGFAPRIVALEPAIVGNTSFVVGLESGLAGAQAVLAIDTDPELAGAPFQGATRFVAMSPNLAIVRSGLLQGSGAGGGWKSVKLTIPLDSGLIGQTRYAQWFVLDLGAGHRFAASEAVQFTYF